MSFRKPGDRHLSPAVVISKHEAPRSYTITDAIISITVFSNLIGALLLYFSQIIDMCRVDIGQ